MAVGETGDEGSDDINKLVCLQGPNVPDPVIQQEGEECADTGAKIDKRDEVGDGAVVEIVGVFERWQLGDGRGCSFVPS